MNDNQIFISGNYDEDEEKPVKPELNFDLSCYDRELLEDIKAITENIDYTYEVDLKVKNLDRGKISISLRLPDIIPKKAEDIREQDGKIYVYVREDTNPEVAYRKCSQLGMAKDDTNYRVYKDVEGSTKELYKMLDYAQSDGVTTVVVGTILDFMNPNEPDIERVLYVLESLYENDIKVISALETDYDIKIYRPALTIADGLSRITLGMLPKYAEKTIAETQIRLSYQLNKAKETIAKAEMLKKELE